MSTGTERDVVDRLRAAHDRLARLREEPDLDPEAFQAVADAYEAVTAVLDRWEERATDWDDFEGYVEFRDDLAETIAELPEDLPEREAFDAADDHVTTAAVTTSLSESDFAAAREALAPAREYAELRADRRDARAAYREARSVVADRRDELEDRREELERLERLAQADLEAPIDELREPIDAANAAVTEAFESFVRERPAREVLEFLETTRWFPLVDVRTPPAELLEYVRSRPAGEHPVPDLLEYSEYSNSKLDHYVENPHRLKRRVATNRTYLEGLSAEPFTVSWPPPPAATLRYRLRERLSLVARFADDDAQAALRQVRTLTRRGDFDRLRRAAVALSSLDAADRERIESTDLTGELVTVRERIEALERALEEYHLRNVDEP